MSATATATESHEDGTNLLFVFDQVCADVLLPGSRQGAVREPLHPYPLKVTKYAHHFKIRSPLKSLCQRTSRVRDPRDIYPRADCNCDCECRVVGRVGGGYVCTFVCVACMSTLDEDLEWFLIVRYCPNGDRDTVDASLWGTVKWQKSGNGLQSGN